MKARNANLKLSVLSLAMVGVFSSMYAYADDEEVAALMNPTSSVTVEEIYVSQGSQKFGEYNGLNKQGGYINGNINVRGGDGYKNNASGDTTRWTIQGTDLGLSDRSASVGYSDQGNWSVGVGYDALQHNLAPGYQTPYQGSMGGNNFRLPSNFGTTTNTTALNATQLNALQANTPDISTTRQNSSFNATKIIDPSLNLVVDFNHLEQSGAKLMGFGSAGLAPAGVTAPTGEKTSILPNPTNYQTDTVNVAMNWQGEKARLTGSYFGSFFRDGNTGVNFMTWQGANNMQTISTAPSNQLQQLNLAGGYDFSSKTKLAGSLSYGRNTQNSYTGYDSFMMIGPASAFNGLVNTSHADVKLTDKSIQDLNLAASYKFDRRDNLSQSNIYNFQAISGSAGNQGYYPNTPLSLQKGLLELSGEYRLTKDQKASLTYGNQSITRWCNQYATGMGGNPGNTYPAGADCLTANSSRSNALDAVYKIKANDSVDLKLGYGVDYRRTTTNQNAIAAFSGTNVNKADGVAPWMVPGQNGGDYLGYMPFFEASRNQQAAKARLNWRATDEISLGLNGKYAYASYPDSTYGVQNSTTWNLGLDGSYQYAELGSVTAYAVQQNSQRNLTNYYWSSATNQGTWNNNLTGHDTTFGLGVKHGGLMSGKVNLNGDLTYSLGQSFYNTTPGALSTGTTYTTASGAFGAPPAIRNDLVAIKLGGTYQIDKKSKVGLQYMYQRLVSSDYYYTALQYGVTPTAVMPTNQTAGGYNVNVITVGYSYSFD